MGLALSEFNSLFYKYLEENKNKTFKYGKFDCFLFVKGFHKTSVGDDFIGNYTRKLDYIEKLNELGYNSIMSYCDDHLIKIDNKNAQRGDIVLYKGGLGLCDGINSIFLGGKGYNFIKTKNVNRVYRCRK